MNQFINYLKDTKAELKHISWPTKDQTVSYTILVIVISLAIALLLGVFDSIFKKALELFILK